MYRARENVYAYEYLVNCTFSEPCIVIHIHEKEEDTHLKKKLHNLFHLHYSEKASILLVFLTYEYLVLTRYRLYTSYTLLFISQRKSNKMQYIKILFCIYMKLNMFRAKYRPSSAA
jgi:hypothetical protein